MKYISLFILLTALVTAQAQNADSVFIKSLYNKALTEGKAYEDLRSLCKDVGARLSGSAEADMAIKWGMNKLMSYNFDTVYLQEIEIPHWERGSKEAAWIETSKGEIIKLDILALGGSVPTEGLITKDLVYFKDLNALKAAKKKDIEGKVVFINQAMDATQITTFKAYGMCWPMRGLGAVEASKKGATAVVIRSLGLPQDDHPHTGSMVYKDDVEKIPAAALSTNSANLLAERLQEETLQISLQLNCRTLPNRKSFNVIAEMWGNENKDEIITFGGHLDSWDVGEGAHDDGAGIVHAMEALRLLKEANYQPKHTLRCVFFMNEENGNMGGKTYANWTFERGEKQIAAIESDRGGFAPRGFSCDGSADHISWLKSLAPVLKPYELHKFEKGYGGVDINPLKENYPDIALFGFVPDSQRYFDFHHTADDVFENVHKRELELGCASMAAFLFLIDQGF
ncbi:M20/M25/M40 family metallo-hydrolase [Lishizhenia sp.]|uniref:M20/M25/M40 family metallo-hydrolase n=1 Tax=Lishizhenia sp. TaxID=2497594 RepID=UPI00299CE13F|nr:M20/M25/M40 family metallo-hydrolase [Lishizhenia sp.]MDX1444864.1 M20/M25/M40 family metallo-hydrolase [Lishizhenia sp.]